MILRAADLRWLPINTVTACRIMLMALFGRHVPDCEADLVLTETELHFL